MSTCFSSAIPSPKVGKSKGKEVWKKYYDNRNAVNLGISGDQTQHVLWRLENGNIEGISPKLAMLMIGTNNANAKQKPEDIVAGVKAIVEKLRDKLPQTKVLLLGIFPRGEDDHNPIRQVNMKANEIIAKLADDKMVFYLDIGDKFLDSDRKLSKKSCPTCCTPTLKVTRSGPKQSNPRSLNSWTSNEDYPSHVPCPLSLFQKCHPERSQGSIILKILCYAQFD